MRLSEITNLDGAQKNKHKSLIYVIRENKEHLLKMHSKKMWSNSV